MYVCLCGYFSYTFFFRKRIFFLHLLLHRYILIDGLKLEFAINSVEPTNGALEQSQWPIIDNVYMLSFGPLQYKSHPRIATFCIEYPFIIVNFLISRDFIANNLLFK